MEVTIHFLLFDFYLDFCYCFTLFFFTYNLVLLYTFLNSYDSKIRNRTAEARNRTVKYNA